MSASFKLWDMSFHDIKLHCICLGAKYRTKLSNQAKMQSDHLGARPDIWHRSIINCQQANSSHPDGKRYKPTAILLSLEKSRDLFLAYGHNVQFLWWKGEKLPREYAMPWRDNMTNVVCYRPTPYYTVHSCILWDMLLPDIKLFCIRPVAKYRGWIKI